MLNNLPAFLVALPHVTGTDHVLALLFGVNVGPTVLVTGSLAGLLWLDAARRHGLRRRRARLRPWWGWWPACRRCWPASPCSPSVVSRPS